MSFKMVCNDFFLFVLEMQQAILERALKSYVIFWWKVLQCAFLIKLRMLNYQMLHSPLLRPGPCLCECFFFLDGGGGWWWLHVTHLSEYLHDTKSMKMVFMNINLILYVLIGSL